jgi:hypothetical protein
MGTLKSRKVPPKPRPAAPPKRQPRTTSPARARVWDRRIDKGAAP